MVTQSFLQLMNSIRAPQFAMISLSSLSRSDTLFYVINKNRHAFALVIIILIGIVIINVLQAKSEKEEQEKSKDNRKGNLQGAYEQVLMRQERILKEYDRIGQLAEKYEDFRTINRLNAVFTQFNELVTWFNESNTETMYYKDITALIQRLYYEFIGLSSELEDIEQEMRDLREVHRKQQSKEPRTFVKKIPLADSKYFRGCASRKFLDQKYRQLVKIYHPDNGGSAALFYEMQADYKKCKERVKA